MDALFKTLAQSSGEILFVIVVSLFVLSVFVILSVRRHSRFQKRWTMMLRGSNGESLENLLYEHLRHRILQEEENEALRSRIRRLEEELAKSKRHVGLVRYDAFDDVSGNQSFALALYDDQGDGAVLNGIVGRSDCRVYCKPLVNGRSERDLSQEEQRAIREARTSGVRTIVSP